MSEEPFTNWLSIQDIKHESLTSKTKQAQFECYDFDPGYKYDVQLAE